MEVIFDKIHDVVLETLEIQDERPYILEVIGKWYYDFLISNQEKLTLYLPCHDEKLLNIIYDYVRLFSLTCRLLKKNPVSNFEGTCLLNIFDYNAKKNNFSTGKSTIDFMKKSGNFLIWSDNIAVQTNRFLPIFRKEQIENSQWRITYNTFKLFKSISNQGLINQPILIDYNFDLCLSIHTGELIRPNEYILFNTLKYNSDMSLEEVIEYEDEACKQNIVNLITLKYPYHKNIHDYLSNIGKKKFDLNINSRFCYNNLQEHDIILLPEEIKPKNTNLPVLIPNFKVFDTNHNLEIFEILSSFKFHWNEYEFNKFTNPFPKYWFLFINPSLPKEDWFEMFKIDYPIVAEKPIINEIKKIIYLLHDLDWGKQLINDIKKPVLLLPEIKGTRKKKLEKSLNSFKHYLHDLNSRVLFIDNNEIDYYLKETNILLLDAFNIINLVNLHSKKTDFTVIIPDFIYFNYQPWIKYHILNYHYEPLLNPIREEIDAKFSNNKEKYQNSKLELIQNIKKDIINYRKKYKQENIEIAIENVNIESEDIIFYNDEEIEFNNKFKKENDNKEYLIHTIQGMEYVEKGNTTILIRKNTLISSCFSQLNIGDDFILQREVSSAISRDKLVDKLSKVPDSVIGFQIQLSKYDNVYTTLEKLGLEYIHSKYFNQKYVVDSKDFSLDKFILPKKKEHWKIICEFLGINSNDMFQAWIAHYGRKHLNEIKKIYKQIYDLCLQNNYLSEIENPDLISKASIFIENNISIFENDEEINTKQIAKSILSSMTNEINFQEVKEIKILN